TPEVVRNYVASFESLLPPGAIIVGHDGRATGPGFAQLVAETLSQRNRHVLDCGACATPTMGVLVKSRCAVGGVQVSASHNPPDYNGLKLFGSDGRVLPAKVGEQVKQHYLEFNPIEPGPGVGPVEQVAETTD